MKLSYSNLSSKAAPIASFAPEAFNNPLAIPPISPAVVSAISATRIRKLPAVRLFANFTPEIGVAR